MRRALTVPNLISLLRLPLAAAFWFLDDRLVRGLLLAAAALTDFLDGRIARRFGARSRAGAFIDPVTDKLFVLVALLSLSRSGLMQLWELLLFLARDLFATAAAAAIVAGRLRIPLHARWSGKVVTTIQLLALILILLHPPLSAPLAVAAGAAGAWAIADYVRAGLRALRGAPADR